MEVILLVDHELNQEKFAYLRRRLTAETGTIYKNSSPPVSHFSTQLKRQKVPDSRGFVVWEQFYTASQANSLCFMHNVAIEHKGGEPTYPTIWRDADISAACELQRGKGLPVNVGEIIQSVCECTVGTPFSIDDVVAHLRQIPCCQVRCS